LYFVVHNLLIYSAKLQLYFIIPKTNLKKSLKIICIIYFNVVYLLNKKGDNMNVFKFINLKQLSYATGVDYYRLTRFADGRVKALSPAEKEKCVKSVKETSKKIIKKLEE